MAASNVLVRHSAPHLIQRNLPGGNAARCAFSIVVPAYNEQLQLKETVERLIGLLSKAPSFEIVIVEDGCTDETPLIAARLCETHPEVQHIHSRVRLGKGLAVSEGIRASRGDVVVLMDADLATDPEHLVAWLEEVRSGETDFLIGSRYHPDSRTQRTRVRRALSVLYNLGPRLLLGSRLRDHQCGFKVMEGAAIRSVLAFVKSDRFFWDTEVLAIAQWHGYRIKEVPIVWREGKASKVRLLRTPLEMLRGLIRLASSRRRLTP